MNTRIPTTVAARVGATNPTTAAAVYQIVRDTVAECEYHDGDDKAVEEYVTDLFQRRGIEGGDVPAKLREIFQGG